MFDKDKVLIYANLIFEMLFSIIFKNCDISGDTEPFFLYK